MSCKKSLKYWSRRGLVKGLIIPPPPKKKAWTFFSVHVNDFLSVLIIQPRISADTADKDKTTPAVTALPYEESTTTSSNYSQEETESQLATACTSSTNTTIMSKEEPSNPYYYYTTAYSILAACVTPTNSPCEEDPCDDSMYNVSSAFQFPPKPTEFVSTSSFPPKTSEFVSTSNFPPKSSEFISTSNFPLKSSEFVPTTVFPPKKEVYAGLAPRNLEATGPASVPGVQTSWSCYEFSRVPSTFGEQKGNNKSF